MTPDIMLSKGLTSRHTLRAVNLACIAGLSLLLARWTWTLLQPVLDQPATALQVQTQAFNLAAVHSTALFGGSTAVNGQSAPAVTLNAQFKLSGVFAALGRLPGFALIAVNGQPAKSFKLNDELIPGYRLIAVYPRYVTIKTPGGMSELHFDTDVEPGSGSMGATSPAAPDSSVFLTIPRSVLQAAQSPATMRLLAASLRTSPGMGVQVLNAPPGSLLAALTLMPGDLIIQINGRSMADPQALAALPQALRGNEIEVVLRRNGVPQTFKYTIQ